MFAPGSFTVLTYPHFLFADEEYANGVVGVTPDLESHRIFLDLEPVSFTFVSVSILGTRGLVVHPKYPSSLSLSFTGVT